jgi:hypothetical protein
MGAPDHPLGPLAYLATRNQFVIAQRSDKTPLHPHRLTPANAHDPANWCSYEHAANIATAAPEMYGVGFVLTAADDLGCIDIDGAREAAGKPWSPLALDICQSMPGAVVEVSQSGRGLHVWFRAAAMPEHAKKNTALHIECYTADRYVLLGTGATGHLADDCPGAREVAARYFPPRETVASASDGPCAEWRGPTDDAELLRRMMQSRSASSKFGGGGASFADLWERNVGVLASAYPPDRSSSEPYDGSSADAALAQHLAFWTGRDAGRIERLMRQSGLVREKYDRGDYLAGLTVPNACSMQREVLQDKEPPAPPVPVADGAPVMRPAEGQRFLAPTEQAALFRGCVYVVDQHRALTPDGYLRKPEQFNAIYGGYTFIMDARNERTTRKAWEAFTESQVLRPPQADGTCFRPRLPYGAMVVDAGRTRVNTYLPIEVPRKQGDASPFLAHLRKLLPNERDAAICLAGLAALVQHQGVKFQWALVVQGVEGNGKTLLSLCVAEAIGERYVHRPKASKLGKDFNKWMEGKTFYAVEDIHVAGKPDLIEELKPMITGGRGLEIEAKGIDQAPGDICGNFIFNTNHKDGLRKTRNDRRFCWLYCAQQEKEDLARDGMEGDYFPTLYGWLERDGYATVTDYLWTYPIPDEFNPATRCQRAPITSSTAEAIERGRSEAEVFIQDAIDQGVPGFAGGWVSSLAVNSLMAGKRLRTSWNPRECKDTLRALGYLLHPGLGATGQVDNPVMPDSGRPHLYVTKGHPALAITRKAEIARAYTTAQGVR